MKFLTVPRSASFHKDDMLEEIAAKHRIFKRVGPAFLRTFTFQSLARTAPLRGVMTILAALDGDGRRPLPADAPLGHGERRWFRHARVNGGIDWTH